MSETIYVEGSGDECDVRVDTWLRDLLPRTPGLVRKVAKRELLLAIREFYTQSSSWRAVIGPKNIIASKARYNMSPYDAYSNVVRILAVAFNGLPLTGLSSRPAGEMPNATSPTNYYTVTPDTITLWPTPTQDYTNALTIYAVLAPKISVNHLPRIAGSDHYDALLDGALSRILAHPAKPYTNTELATYHAQRFRSAIGNFKGIAIQGLSGAQAWSFVPFGI